MRSPNLQIGVRAFHFSESERGSVNRGLGPRGVPLDASYELGTVHPKIHVLPCRVMWESSKQGGAWRL